MWQKTECGSLPPSYELFCLAFGGGLSCHPAVPSLTPVFRLLASERVFHHERCCRAEELQTSRKGLLPQHTGEVHLPLSARPTCLSAIHTRPWAGGLLWGGETLLVVQLRAMCRGWRLGPKRRTCCTSVSLGWPWKGAWLDPS